MSAFDSTITDRELRDLFKARILASDGDDFVTDKFIEMEAKLAFATPAAVFIPMGKEQELLSKLGMKSGTKLAAKFGMKWLFTGLSCATVAVATVVYNMDQKPETPKPAVVAISNVPQQEEDTTTVAPTPEIVTTNSTEPSPAILPEVTKPEPEQLSPFLAEALPVARITPPAMPTLPRGIAVMGFLPIEPPNYFFSMGSEETDTVFSGVKQLEISAVQSDIFIKSSPDKLVHIRTVIPTTENRDEHEVPIYPVEYEQRGQSLKMSVHSNARCGGGHDPNGTLYIEVPEGINMTIHTNNGDVEVKGLRSGRCKAESDFGNVRIENCKMEIETGATSGEIDIREVTGSVKADASFGDIHLSVINGPVNIHSASGAINGTLLQGNTTIVSDFGSVELHRITGMLSVQSTSGSVVIDSLAGTTCAIQNDFGNVTLTNVTATTTLNVESGDISVKDLTGDLTAENAFGDITITQMKGKLIVDNSSGSTSIMDLDGNLDVESDFGNIVLVDTKGEAVITAHSGNVTAKNMELTGNMNVTLDYGNGNFRLKNNYDELNFDLAADFGKVKVQKGSRKKEAENGTLVMTNDHSKYLVTARASSGNILFD